MRMEFIKWIDPFVLDGPWNTDEEIDEKLGDMNCHTIGYIQQETDEFVVLAQGYCLKQDGEVEEWGHCWVLPKICIVHRAELDFVSGLQAKGSYEGSRESEAEFAERTQVHPARSEDQSDDAQSRFGSGYFESREKRSSGDGVAKTIPCFGR